MLLHISTKTLKCSSKTHNEESINLGDPDIVSTFYCLLSLVHFSIMGGLWLLGTHILHHNLPGLNFMHVEFYL